MSVLDLTSLRHSRPTTPPSLTPPLPPTAPMAASKRVGRPARPRAHHTNFGMDRDGRTSVLEHYGPYQFPPDKLIPLFRGPTPGGHPGAGLPGRPAGPRLIHVTDHCRGVDAALRRARPARSTIRRA